MIDSFRHAQSHRNGRCNINEINYRKLIINARWWVFEPLERDSFFSWNADAYLKIKEN